MRKPLLWLGTFLICGVDSSFAETECDPTKFLVQDIEKINYSSSTAVAAYSLVEESELQNQDRKFDGSAIVQGAPVGLSFSEAKSFSRFIGSEYKLQTSSQQALSYVKMAISAAGADAYKACLQNDAETIEWRVDQSALTDPEFFVTVRWTNKGLPNSGDPVVKGQFSITGGAIGGKAEGEFSTTLNSDNTLKVARNSNQTSMALLVSISGQDLTLRFPGTVRPKLKYEKRSIMGKVSVSAPQNDWSAKNEEFCLAAEPGEFLFPSTMVLRDVQKNGNDTSHVSVDRVNRNGQSCLILHADAAGAASHEWSVSARLEVTVAVPDGVFE